jgi:hypothetical protein
MVNILLNFCIILEKLLIDSILAKFTSTLGLISNIAFLTVFDVVIKFNTANISEGKNRYISLSNNSNKLIVFLLFF